MYIPKLPWQPGVQVISHFMGQVTITNRIFRDSLPKRVVHNQRKKAMERNGH